MVAKNDITGDAIQTRGLSTAYEENIVKIFGDKSEEKARKAKENAEYFAKLAAETKARMEYNSSTNKNEYQDILSTEEALT